MINNFFLGSYSLLYFAGVVMENDDALNQFLKGNLENLIKNLIKRKNKTWCNSQKSYTFYINTSYRPIVSILSK